MPSRNQTFIGRDDILQKLESLVKPGNRVAIYGPPGIGKTQLAIEFAHRCRTKFSAILWVVADTEENLIKGYTRIAEQLGLMPPENKEPNIIRQFATGLRAILKKKDNRQEVVDKVKNWLSQNEGWLLIIDNADNIQLQARKTSFWRNRGRIIDFFSRRVRVLALSKLML